MLAGVHLGGCGCGPWAAANAVLPTVVSASRPARASDNSFFFTTFPFPHRSGIQPESSRRGAAIMLYSRTTPFLLYTRVHAARAVPTHTAAAWAAHAHAPLYCFPSWCTSGIWRTPHGQAAYQMARIMDSNHLPAPPASPSNRLRRFIRASRHEWMCVGSLRSWPSANAG